MNGDFAKAREMCVRGRAVLRDLGQGVRAASASLDLAVIELLAGDPAAAEREIRPDCELLEKMGETYFLSTMAAMLARAVREQGRDAEALELTGLAERSAADDDIDAQVLWRAVRAPDPRPRRVRSRRPRPWPAPRSTWRGRPRCRIFTRRH